MKYILGKNFILRENQRSSYILYNKETFYTYTIDIKLYYLLSCFLEPMSFADFDNECKHYNIDNSDFYQFIKQEEFKYLLVNSDSISAFYHYEKPINLPSFTYQTPERVDFVITNHCNLSCKHCFESSSPIISTQPFSEQEIDRVITQLEKAHIKTLKITGGEPLSHPSIKPFLSKITNRHFETNILTNALLIDEELIEIIRNGNIRLGISLDGITNATHDYIRGKGCFEKLIPILRLLKQNDIYLSITCTISKYNIHETESIISFVLDELHADQLIISPLKPMGRATNHADLELSTDDKKHIENCCNKAISIYQDKLSWAENTKEEQVDTIGKTISCVAGNSIIAMDEHFDIYPCIYGIGFTKYKIGNLLNEDLKSIWASEQWKLFRGGTTLDDLTDCKLCSKKEICSLKICRLRPLFEGNGFYGSLAYCGKE